MILRLLRDQNFPKPPDFQLEDVDETVEVVHVHDRDPSLVVSGVPDWLIYLRAAEDGFDGVVTRDWHQIDEPEGLWVLGNLKLVVVSWKRPLNDPVTEWGHLLAYMPAGWRSRGKRRRRWRLPDRSAPPRGGRVRSATAGRIGA